MMRKLGIMVLVFCGIIAAAMGGATVMVNTNTGAILYPTNFNSANGIATTGTLWITSNALNVADTNYSAQLVTATNLHRIASNSFYVADTNYSRRLDDATNLIYVSSNALHIVDTNLQAQIDITSNQVVAVSNEVNVLQTGHVHNATFSASNLVHSQRYTNHEARLTSIEGFTNTWQDGATQASFAITWISTNGIQSQIASATQETFYIQAHTTEWNTAYGWGDHSVAGYLTSLTNRMDSLKVANNSSGSWGSELTTNGSFTGASTWWKLGGDAVYAANHITVPYTGLGTIEPTNTITLVTGRTYRVAFAVTTSDSDEIINVIMGGETNTYGTNSSQTIVSWITARLTNNLYLSVTSVSDSVIIDDISIKEVNEGSVGIADKLWVGSELWVRKTNVIEAIGIVASNLFIASNMAATYDTNLSFNVGVLSNHYGTSSNLLDLTTTSGQVTRLMVTGAAATNGYQDTAIGNLAVTSGTHTVQISAVSNVVNGTGTLLRTWTTDYATIISNTVNSTGGLLRTWATDYSTIVSNVVDGTGTLLRAYTDGKTNWTAIMAETNWVLYVRDPGSDAIIEMNTGVLGNQAGAETLDWENLELTGAWTMDGDNLVVDGDLAGYVPTNGSGPVNLTGDFRLGNTNVIAALANAGTTNLPNLTILTNITINGNLYIAATNLPTYITNIMATMIYRREGDVVIPINGTNIYIQVP